MSRFQETLTDSESLIKVEAILRAETVKDKEFYIHQVISYTKNVIVYSKIHKNLSNCL